MLDPYKMVVVNVLLSSLLFLGAFIYHYIYPKRNVNLFFILIALSLIVCVSIFRIGVYESGDFSIHIYRLIDFYKSLAEGNIMPSWAGTLNATYGYPLFIFNYALPYYIMSLFHFVGFSFIDSMKIFLALNFILSGIFMYLCAKKLYRNTTAAFVTAIFYQFAPYHLIDLHFKNVIGEVMIFTLLPLTLYSLQMLWERKTMYWYVLTSLIVVLLISSHVVLALFAMVLFFGYSLFQYLQEKKKFYVFSTIAVFVLGSLGTIYVWLTPFFMAQYTLFKQVETAVYYPQIWELLYSPWYLGLLFQGPKGELSFLLGYTHIFVVLVLLVILFKKSLNHKYTKPVLFWLSILLIIIFFITPYSIFLWKIFPFLEITGSHRLLLLAAFVMSLLAGYFSIQFLKKRMLLTIVVLVTILSTILNWGHRRVHPEITEQQLINFVWKSTSSSEGHFYANSKWRSMDDPWFSSLPKDNLEVLQGSAEIKKLTRTSTSHSYIVSAKTEVKLQENTLYFPGWQGYDNNQEITIKPDKNGVIALSLSKGLHLLVFRYEDMYLYKVVKVISLSIFSILVGYVLISSFIMVYKRLSRRFTRFVRKNK